MAQGMAKDTILRMGTDKILRHIYDKCSIIRFPDRSEWKDGRAIWYTDVSKTNKDTGLGCMGT
jgi:hypothetical protein